MIREEAAELEHTAVQLSEALKRDSHRAIGVLQVAVGRHRADVDPLAQVGVAQEAVVMLITVALHDARLDLATDPADWPDRRLGQDARAGYDRARTNRCRALDERERLDMRCVHHNR